MAVKIIIRHDSASNWASANPTLALGELGFDTNSKKYKLGDGTTAWNSLSYAGMTSAEIESAVSTAVSNLIDGAPTALDTLNELAAAIQDNAEFFQVVEGLSTGLNTVTNDLGDHEQSIFSVHGITDTRDLVYESDMVDAINTHKMDTTDVHGIADTSILVLTTGATFTGAVNLTSTSTIGTPDNQTISGTEFQLLKDIVASAAEINLLDGVTATTSQLNYLNTATSNIQSQLDEKAPLDGATFTGTTSLPSTTSIGDVSSTEISYVNGVTSNIQTQLNAKAADSEFDSHVSATTSVHGIPDTSVLATTSDVALKANINSPTFTGTVSGITKTMVGLANVDNTSDTNKPVSTAQQTALDAKADLAGDTFTGAVVISDTTESTSTTSGALIVGGGVGIDGNLNAGGVSYFGEPTSLNLTNPVAFYTKDVDDYIQIGIQNPNNGASASSDIVLTADNGTNTTYYLDVGIASSGYDYPDFGFIQPNDGYVLMEGGDLAFAVSTGGKKIEFYIGGTLETDEVGSWSETGLTIDQDLDVQGTITGNLTGDVTGNVTGDLTGDVTGNVSGNAGTVTNGVYTTDTGTVTNTMLAGSISNDKLATITASSKVANSATTATDANTSNAIVARDSSGNFSANMITLAAEPTSNNHAATKSYVDNIAAGISFHEAVQRATTENLDATYANGTSGVGATLTKNSNGSFTIDGSAATANQRILVKNQSDASENGIYYVSTAGDGSNPAVLTRAVDADNSPSGEVSHGDFVFVELGSTYAGYGFINTSTASPIVVGTDDITFSEFSASQSILAGNGLTKSGSTVDVVSADSGRIAVSSNSIDLATVSQSDSTGTAGLSFVQSQTIDAYGRVTGTVSASVQDATTSAKGVASFTSGTFSVTSGAVDVASGGITNSMLAGSIADSKLSTISTSGKVENSATTATELNTASAIVARDASGNFTAGIITADLAGNADTATTATDATNANNVGVTEDTSTNGTKYVAWVDENTGNNPVKTTSTKLTFNPSTGTLSSTVFAGAVEVDSTGVTFDDGTVQITAGVPSITTISQKTSSYTLGSLTERDTIIEIDSTSGTTLTIPLDSAVNYPVGTTLDIIQTNTGQVTIAGDSGVTVNATPGLKLRTRWSSATLLKRAADTWLVFGDLSA